MDNTKGLARKRIQLTEKFEELPKEDREYAYEFRCSFLVDIRKFNMAKLMKTPGALMIIPSPTEHFEKAEKQRDWQREAKVRARAED